MAQKIVLDLPTLKALAGKTRIQILKLLSKRRHMQSELATSLKLAVPTVKEHLAAMAKAGLVIRIDEGRKWKYYELTKKGKVIVEPEVSMHQIWIALSVLVIAAVGGVVRFFGSILGTAQMAQLSAPEAAVMQEVAMEAEVAAQEVASYAPDMAMKASAGVPPPAVPPIAEAVPATGVNPLLIAYFILLAVIVVWLVYSIVKYRKLSKGKT